MTAVQDKDLGFLAYLLCDPEKRLVLMVIAEQPEEWRGNVDELVGPFGDFTEIASRNCPALECQVIWLRGSDEDDDWQYASIMLTTPAAAIEYHANAVKALNQFLDLMRAKAEPEPECGLLMTKVSG